jgi:DNA-binding LacI/PurR family transcriptional regulator
MSSTSNQTPAGRQPLTTAEIAEIAGVSVATVSKVLNGRSDVAPRTRTLVEKVIDKHGHRRRRRPAPATPLVDVVFNTLGGSYAMAAITGVERAAGKHRMGVVVSGLGGRLEPGPDWLEQVLIRRPTAVVTVFCSPSAAQRDQLRSRGIPFAVVDPVAEPAGTPSVAAANWHGGLDATRHLVALGHRRIAVIGGPPGVLAARARVDGYRAALDEAGIAADPRLVCSGEFDVWDGETAAERLLRMACPPTAVFACSDALAAGVYRAASRLGVRIPADLSVVGYDDTGPAEQWLNPPLTTVAQPIAGMAEEATAMVLALARGESPARTRVVLATELVVRASTVALGGNPDGHGA